jgi:hypothetical protein
VKIVAGPYSFLKLISPRARGEIFEEKSYEETSEELSSTEKHGTSVIDWLDAKIADEIAKRFKGIEARL